MHGGAPQTGKKRALKSSEYKKIYALIRTILTKNIKNTGLLLGCAQVASLDLTLYS